MKVSNDKVIITLKKSIETCTTQWRKYLKNKNVVEFRMIAQNIEFKMKLKFSEFRQKLPFKPFAGGCSFYLLAVAHFICWRLLMLFVIYACKCQFSFALKAISSIFYPRRSFFSHHANWNVPSFLSVNRNKPINSASLSFIQKKEFLIWVWDVKYIVESIALTCLQNRFYF